MTDTPSSALKVLRDGLRGTLTNVDSLVGLVQTCLDALGLGESEVVEDLELTRKAIQRYLPSIQIHLLTETLPHFIHALDDGQLRILRSLLVLEVPGDRQRLRTSRWIALTTTLTVPPLLNASQVPTLPVQSRAFLLDALSRVSSDYGIDQLYWAVWTSSEGHPGRGKGAEQLMWEDVTRSVVSVPAKCPNAVGGWKSEGWDGELPANLEAR